MRPPFILIMLALVIVCSRAEVLCGSSPCEGPVKALYAELDCHSLPVKYTEFLESSQPLNTCTAHIPVGTTLTLFQSAFCANTSALSLITYEDSTCSGRIHSIRSDLVNRCVNVMASSPGERNSSYVIFCDASHIETFSPMAPPTVPPLTPAPKILENSVQNCSDINHCESPYWETIYWDSECQNAAYSRRMLGPNEWRMGSCYTKYVNSSRPRNDSDLLTAQHNIRLTCELDYLISRRYDTACTIGSAYHEEMYIMNVCIPMRGGRYKKSFCNALAVQNEPSSGSSPNGSQQQNQQNAPGPNESMPSSEPRDPSMPSPALEAAPTIIAPRMGMIEYNPTSSSAEASSNLLLQRGTPFVVIHSIAMVVSFWGLLLLVV